MQWIPRWRPFQWIGAVAMFVGAVGIGMSLQPRSHAIPSVPLSQLGLAEDHGERALLVAATMPKFQIVGAAAGEDNSKKNVRLWDCMLQLRGSHYPNVPQEVGDCVSWGAANALNYLQAVQLIRGPPANDEFHPAYPPWIYGASRVWVGREHGSRFSGDGSVGAYAAEALQKYGCLRSDHEKVPPYSGSIARQWGASGPPAWAKEVAKAYLVQTVAPVRSADEARDAICNGFPVTIASGWWGTTDIPVVDGRRVARRNTSWGHQQCLIGYDGSGREPYFYCLNSWGPNAHPAPLQNEPPGGYWIRARDVEHICGEGDSWAFSSFDGFPSEGIDWDKLTRRPVASLGMPPKIESGSGSMEVAMFASLCGCVCVCMLGLMLFLRGGRRLGVTSAIAIGALSVGLSCDVDAQDFRGAATRSVPVESVEADPVGWHVAATRSAVVVEAAVNCDQLWQTAACRVEDVVAAEKKQKAQVLVFIRAVGCSDCDKERSYLEHKIKPLGWDVGSNPDADFRIVDVLKDPVLTQKYGVQVVPTAIYVTDAGREVERQEGFVSRSWTLLLKKLQGS